MTVLLNYPSVLLPSSMSGVVAASIGGDGRGFGIYGFSQQKFSFSVDGDEDSNAIGRGR